MNAGLGNLSLLKQHLLPASMQTDSQFDLRLQVLGLGIAGRIETFCDRPLGRQVNAQDIFGADRVNYVLTRAPVESVSLIELKTTDEDGWVVQAGTGAQQTIVQFVQSTDLPTGIVILPDDADPGEYYSQLRITYTGGYTWEQLEPDDAGYPTQQPAGSYPLPASLQLAWLLECQHAWDSSDKLGLGLADKPKQQTALGDLEFLPMVKTILQKYVRMQLV